MVNVSKMFGSPVVSNTIDKKTEVAYVVGAIFLISLTAPIVILSWAIISPFFV